MSKIDYRKKKGHPYCIPTSRLEDLGQEVVAAISRLRPRKWPWVPVPK